MKDALDPNMYGIKIHHPDSGEDVGASFEISGTYEIKPPQDSIRILEFSPVSQEYWPKKYILYNDKEKKWYSTVHIGAHLGENARLSLQTPAKMAERCLSISRRLKTKPKGGLELKCSHPALLSVTG